MIKYYVLHLYQKMVNFDLSGFGQAGDLAYDLRAYYAKIVGEHLIDVSDARKRKDYPSYYNALEDLFTVCRHKFKKTKRKKNQKKVKSVNDAWKSLKQEAIDVFNEHKGVYKGEGSDPKGVVEIERVLRKIEMWIFKKMNESKMFGGKRSHEGLM